MNFEKEIDLIKNYHSYNEFIFPNYKKNCISNIPGTILNFFGDKNKRKLPKKIFKNVKKDINKIVLFVLDGFGLTQFLNFYKEIKFFKNLSENSQILPLTSVFPSQTTNALSTFNTGLTPQEHGLFEYYIYLKEIDRIVNTLRFESIGSNYRNELIENGFNPTTLFNGNTIHNKLRKLGVQPFSHISTSYAYSPCSKLLFKGSKVIPSLKSSDMIVKLRKNLQKNSGPAYFFVHFSNLDTISHEYGPQSYEYFVELSNISFLIQKELVEKIDKRTAKETLLIVTADHGGIRINPDKTVYLNSFPKVIENLQHGKKGKRILPTGSARDVFLHVKEEKIEETKELLNQKIGAKAKIVETKEAIKDGLFGLGKIKKEFLERAGNLLILPFKNETIWFEHVKNRKINLLGHHGGLDKKEMIVPFLITDLKKLKSI